MNWSYSLRVIKDRETGLASVTNSLMSVTIEQALSPVIVGHEQVVLSVQSVCNFWVAITFVIVLN